MEMGENYLELTTFLERNNKEFIKLISSKIEEILGMYLPESVYKHQDFRPNTESNSFAFRWMNAGIVLKM